MPSVLVHGDCTEVQEIPTHSNNGRDSHEGSDTDRQPEGTSRSDAGVLCHTLSMVIFVC
jgi:hypothetical protein